MISCGRLKEEACMIAPTTMIEVPRKIVLLLPNGFPTQIHATAPGLVSYASRAVVELTTKATKVI